MVAKKRPAAANVRIPSKRPAMADTSLNPEPFRCLQIYLPGQRKHLAFTRVRPSMFEAAVLAKNALIDRWADEAWADIRLKREFLAMASAYR